MTIIQATGCFYSDADDVEINIRAQGKDRVLVNIGPTKHSVVVDIEAAQKGWDYPTTQAFELDEAGQRAERVSCVSPKASGNAIVLPASSVAKVYKAFCREGDRAPLLSTIPDQRGK